MSDELPTPPALRIPDGTAAEQQGAAVRDVALLLSALPALIAVLGTHDVMKIVAYLGSADFAPVLGLLVAGGVMVLRQIRTRKAKRQLITATAAAPDSVAVLVSKEK